MTTRPAARGATPPADAPARTPAAPSDAADTLGDLYAGHRDQLVRLAAFLLADPGLAEDAVQDAYIRVHAAWPRIRDGDRVLAYLRRTVVNTARSTLRRRLLGRRHEEITLPDVPSAEESAYAAFERDRIVAAVRRLPRRQREAVVLRYYGGLTVPEIAAAMGCGGGSVKAYLSRGVAALGSILKEETA